MDRNWLPEGHHWDLHIEHQKSNNDAGSFTGGGWKWTLHTTEGGSYGTMTDYLRNLNTPHLVFGQQAGREHWNVCQFLPFDKAAKALRNDTSDGYQTNRANAIQIEIVGFTNDIPNWSDLMYKRLANLFVLIQHRVDIPTKAPRDFSSSDNRMSDAEWVKAEGVVGHMHAPDNDHRDPFRFREAFFLDLVKKCPDGGYSL